MTLRKILIAAALAALFASPSLAQSGCGGQFANNKVCGNLSGAQGLPGPVTLTGSAITGAALTKTDDTNVTLTLGGTPTTALLRASSLTLGWTGQLAVPRGGTGQASFTANLPLIGNGTGGLAQGTRSGNTTVFGTTSGTLTSGNCVKFDASGNLVDNGTTCAAAATGQALTRVDDTNVTLTLGGSPTTSLLAATSITAGWTGQLSLTRGGTAANLTASNGGLVYSTGSAMAILAGTATANQIPLSGANAAPVWSTATYPATAAAGSMFNAGTANIITATVTPTLGVQQTTRGSLTLANTAVGSFAATLQSSNSATAATTITLPPDAGSNGYVWTTNGSGVTSWTSPSSGGTVTSVSFTGGLITVTNPTTTPALTVAGTSGGIPYFDTSSSWASSGALTASRIVLGGGAGAAPTVLGSLGTTTTVLHGNAAGAPTFGAVSLTADVSGILPVANGGTNCGSASGTCLDNITGFSSTGYMNRTGAGTYIFNPAATNANYFAGTSTTSVIQPNVIYQAETTTTFGSTTTFDFSTFINTNVTLTANITTQTLSNVVAGKAGSIRFTQSGAGSFTTVWNSIFKFAGGTTPTLTTGSATAIDVLSYNCITATYCQAALSKDVK